MIIQNGLVIDPSQKLEKIQDLKIKDGKIAQIANPGEIQAESSEKVIDASGHYVTPGLVDMHVHLREPGETLKENIESGTRAAAAGGFTGVACMANTQPVNDEPSVTHSILQKAKATAKVRVFPIGAVTRGLKGEQLSQMAGLVQAGCVALSDDGMPVMNAQLMRHAMEYSRSFEVPIISHSEDLSLSMGRPMSEGAQSTFLGLMGNPPESEEIMIAREISLARLTGARVHIAHLSTDLGLHLIRSAKKQGLKVTAEVTPHHLLLDDESVGIYDSQHKMAPPLRAKSCQEALIEGLSDGTIDAIASDHAPHDPELKSKPFDCAANGVLGLQTTLPLTLSLVHQKRLSLSRWVEALSTAPCKILGLPHGTLEVGTAADITIIDPKKEWMYDESSNLSKSQNSPFLGQTMKGKAVMTLLEGEMIHEG